MTAVIVGVRDSSHTRVRCAAALVVDWCIGGADAPPMHQSTTDS
ncbi:hypothetical protein [Dictyobacter halimunensis]